MIQKYKSVVAEAARAFGEDSRYAESIARQAGVVLERRAVRESARRVERFEFSDV